ncbi:hypothetical protein ACMAZH_07795 [Arenicellales bacterium nBUS_45]
MKAQHAPSLGASIIAQHSFRSIADQTAPVNSQWNDDGKICHRNQIEIRVSAVFSGDEKRLVFIQPIKPVVMAGGGRSGWVPGS